MENLVLYRKYRPQSFAEITGQEHVVKTLTNAILRGQISHAYLFSGSRGSGKTTIARLFAKSINCHDKKEGSAEPCNKCPSCLETIAGRSMDLIEIDAASHRGIDEIRELRDGIKFSPTKEKYKIFILDEAHQLSKDAVNALLKTLEEPPSHAIFILATTEIHKMIPTIISRCQRFDFRKLTLAEIISRLEYVLRQENIKVDKSALELIALNSGGSIRDAESLLDQVLTFTGTIKKEGEIKAEDIESLLGIANTKTISSFIDYLIAKDAEKAIEFLNSIFERGYDLQEFAKSLIRYLRQVLLLKINPEPMNPMVIGLTKEEQEQIKKQAESFLGPELGRIINQFLEAEGKMKYSSIPQLPLELVIIDITEKK